MRENQTRTWVRLLGGFLVALGISAGVTVRHVAALPSREVDRLYYDDATFSNVVGDHILDCSGNNSYEGTVPTDFLKEYSYLCNDPQGNTTCVFKIGGQNIGGC